MYSIIIAVISIALVVVLAGASIYYGGTSFTDGNAKATSAQYRSEATQISGALSLYKAAEGVIPESFVLSDLAPEYLKEIPAGTWSVDAATNRIVRTGLSNNECLVANEASGHYFYMSDPESANYVASLVTPTKGIPRCDWPAIGETVPCCYTE